MQKSEGRINMPKSSKKQINEDEKKILKVLQTSSGDNIDKIAKKCGFSRQKLWRIKKRMEKDKTIWGYHAVADDEKLGLIRYIMLLKRSAQPLGDAANNMTDLIMHEKGGEIGVNIICSRYLHGKYDWMFVFTAEDIKHAKKFSETLTREYHHVIKEIIILEDIFSVKECGMANPEIKKLREFF